MGNEIIPDNNGSDVGRRHSGVSHSLPTPPESLDA
jgi:hypothetical protein